MHRRSGAVGGSTQKLIDEINPKEDSLRFYFLGSNWKRRIEHIGAKKSIDQEGPLII